MARFLAAGDVIYREGDESIQRLNGKLDVLRTGVLFLRVTETAQALHEEHYRRHAGPSHLGSVMKRTARQKGGGPRDLFDGPLGETDQLSIE